MTAIANRHSGSNVLFYSFLALLIWLPLPLGSNKHWAVALMSVASFGLTAWWLVLFSLNRVTVGDSFKRSLPIVFLVACAPAYAYLQLLTNKSLDSANTLQEALQGSSLICIFLLSTLLLRTKQRIRIVCYTLVISGLFQAVFGSMMTLTGIEYSFFIPKEAYLDKATGTFINRNHLAGYLVLTLSIGIGLMISTLNGQSAANWRDMTRRLLTTLLGSKARLRIILIMMVAGLVLTHSRMGNTAFFASLAIAGVIALILSKRSTKSTIVLISSLIVIDIFVVGTFFGVEKVAQRLQTTSEQGETRDEVNSYTIDAIAIAPLEGYGAGTFYTLFPEHREEDAGRGFYDHTHNDYLEFASDYGLVVTSALILAVLLCFISAIRAQMKRKDTLMRGIAFSCTMAVIALAIHSTVDFNLQIPANAATFMVILALGQISLHQQSKKRRSSRV